MATLTTKAKTYSQIADLIKSGIESWIEAGKIIAKLIDDGVSAEDIAHNCGVPRPCICKLENVGRGLVLPELLLGTFPAASPMTRLPVAAQKKALTSGVEVLLGSNEILKITAENLTPLQCKQVFDGKDVRTPPAQRAWVESQKTRNAIAAPPVADGPYSVKSQRIIINGPCTLTRKDLLRMLNEIEA